jgi:hypothetical protein
MNRSEKLGLVFLAWAFLLLVPVSTNAQGTVTFVENFDNNVNGWWTGKDQDGNTVEVKNGVYRLVRKVDNLGWTWPSVPIPIDYTGDFQIECSLRLAEGQSDQGRGIIWGFLPGHEPAFHYFVITDTNICGYGLLSKQKWDYVDEKCGHIRPAPHYNLLTVNKKGGELSVSLNGTGVTTSLFRPAFGKIIGIFSAPKSTIDVDRLTVTTQSEKVPKHWSVVSEGSFRNSFVWQNRKDESLFRGEVHNFGVLMAGRYLSGDQVYVTTEVKNVNDTRGERAGIYLQTDEGAMLKLDRAWSPQGIVVRFSAVGQGKKMGSREILLPHASTLVYRIVRKGDNFKGEVLADGKKTLEVGDLSWPNLSNRQIVGAVMTYEDTSLNAPPFYQCDFKDFSGGKIGE